LTYPASHPRALMAIRQRPGRRFPPDAERQLERAAKRAARELPDADAGLLALREFHAPFGVPDLTVIVGDASARRSRLRLRVPPVLNEIDAGLVATASDIQPVSPRQLAQRLSWSLASVTRRLPSVLRSGALREVTPERYIRPAALQPVGTIFAVETKLNDWRRALTQCRTYRTWADSYVLVMPKVSSEAMTVLSREVRRDRGGLFIDQEWVVYPRTTRLARARRLWASEHVIAACRRSTTNPRSSHTG
jgi:short subunit dehydrogenase-like uncharacterized protein